MCAERRGRSRGFTLVEMVVAIAIVGVTIAGVFSVFIVTARHSADPMIRQQSQFIAEAYLEEILRQRFYDADDDRVCPTAEGSRALFDNVCDYAGISGEAPTNALGNPLGLTGYTVSVTVTRDATVNLNGIDNTGVVRVVLVDVTVTGPDGNALRLTGYRTNYNCDAAGNPGCKSL